MSTAFAAGNDIYEENFDNRTKDATINSVDQWKVYEGDSAYVTTDSSSTYSGAGKSLKITSTENKQTSVLRAASYGSVTPCWVEFLIKAGSGAEARSVPTKKIAAVSFDHTGRILASDGASWLYTGKTYDTDEWYKVILKLDFSTHLYDIYIYKANENYLIFEPAQSGLDFIDNTINSLNGLGFSGAYHSLRKDDDTYIDSVLTHFVKKIAFTTAGHSMVTDQVSGIITVQLQNSNSEPQTAWEDIILEISSSSITGEISLDKEEWDAISEITIPEGANSATVYYKDSTACKPVITVDEYPDRGWEAATQEQEVIAGISYFDISVASTITAGISFPITITAMDDDGKVDETYNKEVEVSVEYVSPGVGTKLVIPATVTGFVNGVLTTDLTYTDAGAIKIIITDPDELDKAGISGEIMSLPSYFTITSAAPQVTERNFDITVSAYNSIGELTPNYNRECSIKSVAVVPPTISGGSFSPSAISGNSFLAGIANQSVSYNRWGVINIKVYDTGYPNRSGELENMKFKAASLAVKIKEPPVGRNFFYTGEDIDVTLKALSFGGAEIANYSGLISIQPIDGFDLPGEYQFIVPDAGSHIITSTAKFPGTYNINISSSFDGLSIKSDNIVIKQATIEVVSTSAPIGSTEVIIKIVDEDGAIIKSENTVTILVELEEEYSDSSATTTASTEIVSFVDGIAKILVSDTQPEVVTITPKADYIFKVKKGSVKFGRIAKTGIGALMWREIKSRPPAED